MAQIPIRLKNLKRELFSTEDSTCFFRGKFFTDVYKKTEGQTPGRRQAAALYETFTKMPIFIRPDELIVGQRSSRLGAHILYPEYNLGGIENWSKEAYEYWKTRTLGHFTKTRHPEALTRAEAERAAGYQTGTDTGYGHVIADYPKVLQRGLAEVIQQADAGAAKAEDNETTDFYESVSLTCRGIVSWAGRYADLAEEEAAKASPLRAEELCEIARICRKVPALPADTFHEALQSFWFVHLALHIEQHGWSISAGRFDQFMYPYFTATSSLINTRELLLSLWMKFMENVGSKIRVTIFQNITLGGQLKNGADACNRLTLACLDATADLGMNQPALSFRWHSKVDPAAWAKVIETISKGYGMPALFNDEVIIPALIKKGVSRADAFGYGIVGCVEASVPGKEQGVTAGGHINLAKALELALNDGVSTVTGRHIGISTGNPAQFLSYESVWSAYTKQINYLCDLDMTAARISGEEQQKRIRYPLLSALLDDCMKTGRDLVFGSVKYRLPGVAVFGASNVYDGLAAIRKHVFRDKAVSMAELCSALRDDFNGHDRLQARLANETPRFGNDIDEVDDLCVPVGQIHADRFWAGTDPRGGHFTCGIWPVEGHVGTGKQTGATPDGRRSGTPIVDGVGACQGADKNGPTALLKSVAKLPNRDCWTAGNTCNIKFTPRSVRAVEGATRLSNLLKTYMQLGGQQIQVNIVDTETLLAAKAFPEEHRDLIVRVAGFSAYFVDLAEEVQDEIISRNAHEV